MSAALKLRPAPVAPTKPLRSRPEPAIVAPPSLGHSLPWKCCHYFCPDAPTGRCGWVLAHSGLVHCSRNPPHPGPYLAQGTADDPPLVRAECRREAARPYRTVGGRSLTSNVKGARFDGR